jgi:aminopeptidase N
MSRPLAILLTCLLAVVALGAPAAGRAGAQPAPRPIFLPLTLSQWTGTTASLGDPYAPGLGNPGYDVQLYDLDLRFGRDRDQPLASYDAVAVITARSTVDRLARVSFDLEGVRVREVRVWDAAAAWYEGPGNKLWVDLPEPLAVDQSFRVRISYADDLVAEAPSALVPSPLGAGEEFLWTEPDWARSWFPANDHPSDRARFRFTIRAPQPYVSVANGRLTRLTPEPVTTTSVFETAAEMAPRDASLHIGPYEVIEAASPGGVPIRHYVLGLPEQRRPTVAVFEAMLATFEALLPPYPHEGFGVVESGIDGWRGVPSLVLLGRGDAGLRPGYLQTFAGGAVAAQWFGGAIGVDSPGDDWVNDGASAYLGMLYHGQDQGPEPVRARIAAEERNFVYYVGQDVALNQLPPDGSAAFVEAFKSPWLYHTLRARIGLEKLTLALQLYYRDRSGGFADLDALQSATEEALGHQNLTTLFDTLARSPSTPRANLAWLQDGNTLRVRVCQFTAQPVTFDLPVALHGAGEVDRRNLVVRNAFETVDWTVAGPVSALTPDPEQALLADIVVHPIAESSLPACDQLPVPPLPSAGAPAGPAGWVQAAIEQLAQHDVDPVLRQQVNRQPRAARASLAAAIEAAQAVPGEPSIGDPYLPYLGNTGYDVDRYRVDIEIDPDTERVAATTTIQAHSTLEGLDRLSLDFYRMEADAGMVVSRVLVNDAPAAWQRPNDVDKLWVNLPAPLASGQPFTVTVGYGGTPIPAGEDVFSGGLRFFDDAAYGKGAYAISEPDGARNWIPCNDHPRDKALFHFEITVPAGYEVAANGRPQGKTIETAAAGDGSAPRAVWTYRFEMAQPMATYLATVAVGRYRTGDQAGPGGIPITHYFLNDPTEGLRVAGVTPDVLATFNRLVAPYPFDTYGHYASPGFGGGMENQTMTAIGPNAFSSPWPRAIHGLIAHEAAHQWFGDALSPDSWADIWLNEGFATYFDQLFRFNSTTGAEPLGWRMDALGHSVLAFGAAEPVSHPSLAEMFGTNTYSKGAWVLHLLRAELGEEAFWQGIGQYFSRHTYGTVSTTDFRVAMEVASGRDLHAWFAQWVDRPDNPTVRVMWRQSGGDLTLRLCQSGEPYALRLPVAVHTREGREPERTTVELDGSEKTVTLAVTAGVIGITVDPDNVVLADLRVQRARGAALPACGLPGMARR